MGKGNSHFLSRRGVTAACGGMLAGVLIPSLFASAQTQLLARPIPHGGGERLPAVGVGTVNVFDVGSRAEEIHPRKSERAMVAAAGRDAFLTLDIPPFSNFD